MELVRKKTKINIRFLHNLRQLRTNLRKTIPQVRKCTLFQTQDKSHNGRRKSKGADEGLQEVRTRSARLGI